MVQDYIRGIGELTLKGLVANNAPRITKGMINELFRQYNITVEKIIPLIQENRGLWSMLPPEYYDKIKKAVRQAGSVDWFTSDWVIEAVRKEHPALASLFLGWRKGRNWLDRQANEIRKEVGTLG